MRQHIAICKACGWESLPADLSAVAATLGLEHLTQVHKAAAQAEISQLVRVWQFDALDPEQIDEFVHPTPPPEPKAPPPAAHPPAAPPPHHIKRVKPGKEHR